MSKKIKELNAETRKQEKEAKRAENIAKVQETKAKQEKPKTVWDLLKEERTGTKTTTDVDGKVSIKSKKVRKTLAINCHAHRKSGKLRGSVCIQRNDMSIVRVKRVVALAEVKAGKAKYIPRHIWKESVKNLILHTTEPSKTETLKTIPTRKSKRVWVEKTPDSPRRD